MLWEWLGKNIGSIIVLLIVAAMIVLLVFYLFGKKKKGGSCSGCAGCPHAASCPSKMLGEPNKTEIEKDLKK